MKFILTSVFSAFILLAIIYFISYSINYFRGFNGIKSTKKGASIIHLFKHLKEQVKNYFNHLKEQVKNYFNYSHRIYIKINLGHDNIKEGNILKTLSTCIRKHFVAMHNSFRKNIFFRILFYGFIILAACLVYKSPVASNVNENLRKNLHVDLILPSQNKFVQNNFDTIYSVVNKKPDTIKYSYHTYWYILSQIETNNTLSEKELKDMVLNNFKSYSERDTIKLGEKALSGSTLLAALTYVDIHLMLLYRHINHRLLANVLPPLSYLFVAYLFLIWLLSKLLLQLPFVQRASYSKIIRKLDTLEALIATELTEEGGRNTGASAGGLNLSFFSKQVKKHPKADINEIEKRLIEILDLTSTAALFNRVEFIFIFDELDKIEPVEIAPNGKGGAYSDKNLIQNILFSPHEKQKRLNQIMSILSDLKYFLSTAKAKFIFIAGREIFDAALADASDRDFFIHSIFNEIVYVDSFLTDDSHGKISDISSMTERFVCRYLWTPKETVLESINEYIKKIEQIKPLQSTSEDNDHKNKPAEPGSEYIDYLKRQKVYFVLKHLVAYITHFSNGAPSKVESCFEQLIEEKDYDKIDRKQNLVIGDKSCDLFLTFSFYKQYELGLIYCLTTPIHLTLSSAIKEHGDKTLISGTFLINRLMKFHNYGFAWSSLERAPEIIDPGRTPEARSFIAAILNYLSRVYVQHVVNGLFTYNFSKRVSKEIALLSAISEKASAAFNFTLDETLNIRYIYHEKLNTLKEGYKPGYNDEKGTKYIPSVASVYEILANLHFYAEEYNQAITYFHESLQYLRTMKEENMDDQHLMLYIRRMLMLGMCYERRRVNDPAYITYTEASAYILKYINTKKKNTVLNGTSSVPSIVKVQKKYQTVPFDALRLLYLPFLAKFQLIEKNSFGGITDDDIQTLENESESIFPFVDQEKYLYKAYFWNKAGNILFYKNGDALKKEPKEKFFHVCKEKTCKLYYTCKYYCESLDIFLGKGDGKKYSEKNTGEIITEIKKALVDGKVDDDKNSTKRFSSLTTLAHLLSDIGDLMLSCPDKEQEIREGFLKEILTKGDDSLNPEANKEPESNTIPETSTEKAITFYKLSGCCFKQADEYKKSAFQDKKILMLLYDYFYLSSDNDKLTVLKNCLEDLKELCNRAVAKVFYAYDSIQVYETKRIKDAGNKINRKSPLYSTINSDVEDLRILYKELKLLLFWHKGFDDTKKLLQSAYKAMDTSPYSIIDNMYNRVLKLRYKSNLNFAAFMYFIRRLLDHITDAGNIKERFVYRYETTKSTLTFELDNGETISEAMVKVLERSPNYKLGKYNIDPFSTLTISEAFVFLISDSIFCLHYAIKEVMLFGQSNIFHHSYLANLHEALFMWSSFYNAAPEQNGFKEKLTEKIKELLGEENSSITDSGYQCQKALKKYEDALSFHKEGRVYKNTIEHMCFLNDDYSDHLYNFNVAIERYRINVGYIKDRIKALEALKHEIISRYHD